MGSVRDEDAGCGPHAAVLRLSSTNGWEIVPTEKWPTGNDGLAAGAAGATTPRLTRVMVPARAQDTAMQARGRRTMQRG